MALEKKELQKLMKLAAGADKTSPSAYSFGDETFTYDQVNEALRTELNELAGDYKAYRRNKNLIFDLIESTIDEILPKKVLDQYGAFAEVQTIAQGDKAVFSQRITEASKLRAKAQFVTRVGLAGVYEVFRLDGRSVTVETTAYGGAAYIALEEFLDGRITMADVLDIVLEGLDEAVYKEIGAALVASISSLPAANQDSAAGFDATKFDRLLQTADVYGPATIYCSYELASKMLPATSAVWSDAMAGEKWANGYFTRYHGHTVVILPNSFADSTNANWVMPRQYAWIIAGGTYKPIKIAFEGQTITQEFENRDGSREIQIYKKLGVATMVTSNVCVYTDTALTSLANS